MSFQYSIQQLIEVKQFFKDHPDGTIKLHGVWPNDTLNKAKWHKWFMDCLNRKINRNENKRGRKDDPDWWRSMIQSQVRINQPRLIIDWLPLELKSRFSYRLRENVI